MPRRTGDADLDHERWVAIAVATDDQWQALRSVLGDPPWATDPALSTMAGRRAGHDDIDRHLADWCRVRGSQDIVGQLLAAGVPAAPVVHPSEQLQFDQLVHRTFFEHVEHPVHGDSVHVTYPFRLPGASGNVHRRAAPMLGEHNREVFCGLLGITDDELEALEATGVIGTILAT